MDEPTAALSAHEVGQLFKQVRLLTAAGVAVLFISHRLEEVFEIADRVTVLRDGRFISTRPRAEVTQALAIQDMVGRDISDFFARTRQRAGRRRPARRRARPERRLLGRQLRGARAARCSGSPGLVGAGRTDVGLALFGIAPADAGRVELRRQAARAAVAAPGAARAGSPTSRRTAGALGLSLPQSVTANVTLATLRNYVNRLRLLDGRAERATAERFREKLAIRTPSLDTPVEQPLRRQPAEDDAREVAERAAEGPRSSTSRPAASTSAPRPRSTTSSTSSPPPAWRSSSSPPTSPRCSR